MLFQTTATKLEVLCYFYLTILNVMLKLWSFSTFSFVLRFRIELKIHFNSVFMVIPII